MHNKPAKVPYSFEAAVWKHDAPAAWYFVSVPKDLSAEIRKLFQQWEEGWGRLKCQAKIGNTAWDTAIWYDSRRRVYILPLKAEIRRKEQIDINRTVPVTISI